MRLRIGGRRNFMEGGIGHLSRLEVFSGAAAARSNHVSALWYIVNLTVQYGVIRVRMGLPFLTYEKGTGLLQF